MDTQTRNRELEALRQLELAVETAHSVGIPVTRSVVVQRFTAELVAAIEGAS